MSGASRACSKASGSIDLAVAYSLACARMLFNAVSICLRTGTEWEYIGLVMGWSGEWGKGEKPGARRAEGPRAAKFVCTGLEAPGSRRLLRRRAL